MIHQKILGKFLPLVAIAFIILSVYHFINRPNLFQTEGLRVAAAISVSNALEEIEEFYQSRQNYPITYNFAASGKLRQQIEQGAPVDIYLSAGSNHMDILQKKN